MKNEDVTKGDKRFGAYTVGKLEISIWRYTKNEHSDQSMELFFLHYHSEKEAKEKWARRIKRIS